MHTLMTYNGHAVRVRNDRKSTEVMSSVTHNRVFSSFQDIRKAMQTNLTYLAILPRSTCYLLNARHISVKIFLRNEKLKTNFQDFFHSSQSVSSEKLKGSP